MISGSLCGMFQWEEEHKRKLKLCAIGSIPAFMIVICLFYSLCIWLCLISLLLPRIIPAAAAEHRVDLEFLPRLVLGSTSCCWPHCRASRRVNSGAGSGNGVPKLLQYSYTCNHTLEQLQPHKRNAKLIQHAAALQGTMLKHKQFN